MQRNDNGTFAEAMQFIVPTNWGFFLQPQLDVTNEFSHGNDSRMIRLKILMIRHHKNFETTAYYEMLKFVTAFCFV